MAEVVELIPASERDEAIYAAWETGKGLRTLAKEFGIPIAEIERTLDRMLPAVDAQHGLFAYKRELRRLEDLSSEFFAIAKRDKDKDAAHLCARLNERISSMRGWSSVSIRMDPTSVQRSQEPSNYERIREAVLGFRERQRSPLALEGNGAASQTETEAESAILH